MILSELKELYPAVFDLALFLSGEQEINVDHKKEFIEELEDDSILEGLDEVVENLLLLDTEEFQKEIGIKFNTKELQQIDDFKKPILEIVFSRDAYCEKLKKYNSLIAKFIECFEDEDYTLTD